jgi:GTPase SAR1 family protein
MIDMWISFGEGFLLVFAINDAESFEKVKGKRDRILKGKHGIKCPIILVGNKHDLENERKVAFDDAKKLADSWGAEYIETSAKTNFNCKEAFERLSQKILAAKNPPPKSSCPSTCLCNIM